MIIRNCDILNCREKNLHHNAMQEESWVNASLCICHLDVYSVEAKGWLSSWWQWDHRCTNKKKTVMSQGKQDWSQTQTLQIEWQSSMIYFKLMAYRQEGRQAGSGTGRQAGDTQAGRFRYRYRVRFWLENKGMKFMAGSEWKSVG